MKLEPYPDYKDSGVEWLGDVPAHWEMKRLKQVADVRGGVAKGKDQGGIETISVPYLRVANVQDGYLDLTDVEEIEVAPNELERYLLQSGDVLMNEGGDYDKLGRGHVWRGEISPCIHQNHVFSVRPHDIRSEWLTAITSSEYAKFFFMCRAKQSTNLASISLTNLSELPIVLPPESEQMELVQFLGHETAKIDALISEQQDLIALLHEKRQAVISNVIAKGINHDVPLKDSGEEWLGLIPTHWEPLRLKQISPAICVGIVVNPSEYITDDGVPFIYGSDIKEGYIDLIGCRRMSSDSSRANRKTVLCAGDLLTVRVGYPGLTAVVSCELEGGNCASVMLTRGAETFNSYWLCYAMNSQIGKFQIERVQYGAAQEQFNIGHAVNFIFPTPPIEEQGKIVEYLNEKTSMVDELILQADSTIALLQEHRTALISAVVTGKVDVHEVACV